MSIRHAPLTDTAAARRAPFATYLIPGKEWYSPREAAEVLGRTDQYVRDCFLNQKILGHTANARSPRGRERRRHYQIHRDSLLLYLCETANYTPDDYLDRLAELIERASPEQRALLARSLAPRPTPRAEAAR
jgi:hypothetical protein